MAQRISGVLLVALLYWLSGTLVSQTGLHTQVLPFWVGSGLALAVCYRYGYWTLTGVWLGSFAFNFSFASHDLLQTPSTSLVITTAALLAIGAAVQGGVGAWLLKNRLGNPLTARSEGKILRFILVIGFATSLISATWGSLLLNFLLSPSTSAGWWQDWFTWWMGDSFGVVIAGPLVLALLSPKQERKLPRPRLRLIQMYTMTLVGVLIINHLYIMQMQAQMESSFNRDVDVFHANLNRLYQQNLADLAILERQVIQNRGISAQAFRSATHEILQRNASIRAYSWDPIIHPDELAEFEAQTREELNYPEFAVYGDSPHPNDPLIPVQYVEPMQDNLPALGFNLLSIEDRQRWVLQSQETGRAIATEILNLTQAPDEPGLLILQPVYLSLPSTDGSLLSADKHLAGFMVAVFTASRMVDAAVNLSGLQGIQLSFYEYQATQPFYTYPYADTLTNGVFSQDFEFDFAQQRWEVRLTALPTYLAIHPNSNLMEFQALLVLLSALASLVMLGMHNREATLAHRVAEQTHTLAFQAEHDSLTGLPNRLKLEHDCQSNFDQGKPHQALLFIGLDRFKLINDSLGHLTGDRLLIEISGRIKDELQDNQALYRAGGDEFILLHPLEAGEGHASTLTLAHRILHLVSQPLISGNLHVHITASIGIAFAPEQGKDVTNLIRNSDTALHQAKIKGKNRFEVYQSSHTLSTRRHFELEQDLRLAINTPQFFLHYQPQYQLTDDALCGFEALVRWEHPDRGLISPAMFIELAEETQLILPLGWQLIDQVCRRISQWHNEGFQVPCVAVNISPLQLMQADFVEHLNLIVDSYGLKRSSLELEITETLLHQDPDFASAQLRALHLAGYRLALDDFGTGYSSFNRLKQMPLNRIKIDRTFVKDIGKNPKDEAIILSIISLSQSLEIEVLAEGVETQEQYDYLRQHGCDSIQGYLMGRPVAQPVLQRA